VLGIALTHVQDLALGLIELHEARTGPPLQPVQVPLVGIPSLQRVKCTTQLGVITNLLRVHSIPLPMCRTKMLVPVPVLTPEERHSSLVSTWTLSH